MWFTDAKWKIWLAAVTLFISVSLQAAEHHLSLVTAAQPPLGSSADTKGFLERLAKECFSRIGYEVEVNVLPGERALINANTGVDDGDLYRAPGFEKTYPNLIKVPETIGVMEFMAYSQNIGNPKMDWNALRPYIVAFATGWKIYDRNVKAKEVTKVRSINELFPLLQMGRADLVLMDRWQGSYLARKQGIMAHRLEPPLARVDMYMYLNKHHEKLIPRLVSAIREMKKDGTYQRIFAATLKKY